MLNVHVVYAYEVSRELLITETKQILEARIILLICSALATSPEYLRLTEITFSPFVWRNYPSGAISSVIDFLYFPGSIRRN